MEHLFHWVSVDCVVGSILFSYEGDNDSWKEVQLEL